jgi:Zn-dependent protease with chaperone function
LLLTLNSRHNEFAADAFAVGLGKGKALASGLIKISIGRILFVCFCCKILPFYGFVQ